ncbi:hypothetical protein K7432_011328, partial [Basidiobolus ranarum]
ILAGLTAVLHITAAIHFPYSYPDGCVESCSLEAGRKCCSHYTQDVNSPYFVDSLACLCDPNNPGYEQFYTDIDDCMDNYSWRDEWTKWHFEAFTEGKICAWYNQKKATESKSKTPRANPTMSIKVTAVSHRSTTDLHKSTETIIASYKSTAVTTDSHKPTKASLTLTSLLRLLSNLTSLPQPLRVSLPEQRELNISRSMTPINVSITVP